MCLWVEKKSPTAVGSSANVSLLTCTTAIRCALALSSFKFQHDPGNCSIEYELPQLKVKVGIGGNSILHFPLAETSRFSG